MNKNGVLSNRLELAHSPVNAYVFNILRKEKEFIECLYDSHLYIIVQRRDLSFNNFDLSSDTHIKFEIHQPNNDEVLYCEMPIHQKHIMANASKDIQDIQICLGTNKYRKFEKVPPYSGVDNIFIREIDKNGERKLLFWLYPERFLQNFWRRFIGAKVVGDIRSFLNYKVHYVGKATEQNICKRLTGHSNFQDVLSHEIAFTYGDIPSQEITILLFRVVGESSIKLWRGELKTEDFYNSINYQMPTNKTLSLDAEKALIKTMKPEYNKTPYKSYPNNNDLINIDNHHAIVYSLSDPIRLIYESKVIKGDESTTERDFIVVRENGVS